jgi:integrase
MSTTRYQEGSIARVRRAKGPDVWVYRWRDTSPQGSRTQRARTIGTVGEYKRLADAKRAIENLRAEVNAVDLRAGKMTVLDAWGHFQKYELRDPDVDRSPTTINSYLDYFKCQILPTWEDVALDEVKSVAVEKWLRSLDLAPGTKAKIRSHLSSLFSHCIRHELYTKSNPITTVRQSAVRQRDPDILTLEELRLILTHIDPPAIRVMVATAAASALRRSELRGLRWADLDFEGRWFRLQRGLVRKDETKMKTKASRKGSPMIAELAEMLQQWRSVTPYPTDSDWVFASPYTQGKRSYWAESAMQDHIQPAAKKAGITKHVHWHVFRHSCASLMGQRGEDVKVVQELLRHATSRITTEVYQQGNTEAKRSALSHMSGIFAVAPKKAS